MFLEHPEVYSGRITIIWVKEQWIVGVCFSDLTFWPNHENKHLEPPNFWFFWHTNTHTMLSKNYIYISITINIHKQIKLKFNISSCNYASRSSAATVKFMQHCYTNEFHRNLIQCYYYNWRGVILCVCVSMYIFIITGVCMCMYIIYKASVNCGTKWNQCTISLAFDVCFAWDWYFMHI